MSTMKESLDEYRKRLGSSHINDDRQYDFSPIRLIFSFINSKNYLPEIGLSLVRIHNKFSLLDIVFCLGNMDRTITVFYQSNIVYSIALWAVETEYDIGKKIRKLMK